jgi:hypothetical protein
MCIFVLGCVNLSSYSMLTSMDQLHYIGPHSMVCGTQGKRVAARPTRRTAVFMPLCNMHVCCNIQWQLRVYCLAVITGSLVRSFNAGALAHWSASTSALTRVSNFSTSSYALQSLVFMMLEWQTIVQDVYTKGFVAKTVSCRHDVAGCDAT